MEDLYSQLVNSSEKEFERIFSELMVKKYKQDYCPTLAWGRIGDKGVDGVLYGNIAFAIYGPKEYKDKNALTKIKKDHKVFIEQRELGYWEDITELRFVIKNTRQGVTPTVIHLINQLNKEDDSVKKYSWTMENIYNDVGGFIVPKLPYETINNLYSDVIFLREEYKKLREIYIGLGKNSNVLFDPKMQSEGIQWYNRFEQIHNVNCDIYKITYDFYKYFEDLNLIEYITQLIELRPPFEYNICTNIYTIYDGFERLVDDKKYNRINEICQVILDKLNEILNR